MTDSSRKFFLAKASLAILTGVFLLGSVAPSLAILISNFEVFAWSVLGLNTAYYGANATVKALTKKNPPAQNE